MKKKMSEGLICMSDLLWSFMIDGSSWAVEEGWVKDSRCTVNPPALCAGGLPVLRSFSSEEENWNFRFQVWVYWLQWSCWKDDRNGNRLSVYCCEPSGGRGERKMTLMDWNESKLQSGDCDVCWKYRAWRKRLRSRIKKETDRKLWSIGIGLAKKFSQNPARNAR